VGVSVASTSFDSDLLESARVWIAGLPGSTREKAVGLQRRGAVRDIESYQRGVGFRAEVDGDTGLYDTKVRFLRGGWSGECTCPVGVACKHSAALLLAALEALDLTEPDEEEEDEKRSELIEQWRDWLAQMAQASAATPEAVDLRLRCGDTGVELQWRKSGSATFAPVKETQLTKFISLGYQGMLPFEGPSLEIWRAFHTGYDSAPAHLYTAPDCVRILNTLLRNPALDLHIVGPMQLPFNRPEEALTWRIDEPEGDGGNYRFTLALPDGSPLPPALIVLDGRPSLYVTRDTVFRCAPLAGLPCAAPVSIPAEAIESTDGLTLFSRIDAPLPPRIATRVRAERLRPVVKCWLEKDAFNEREWLHVEVRAESSTAIEETYTRDGWKAVRTFSREGLRQIDRSALEPIPALIESLKVTWSPYDPRWQRATTRTFAQQFADWLLLVPADCTLELDPLLASFREAPIAAKVKLEVSEAGIDWFDLRIALDVADTKLTKAELKALLDARGGFVRLGAKGWRRLAFEFSAEDETQLADLGLDARDFSSTPQRMHALQLAGKSAAKKLLPEPTARAIEQRIEEIRTRVVPDVPAGLRAELRPYQIAGFHFLAYLSTNHFGGILADDMGLGKTVQTLAWLLWMRAGAPQVSSPSSDALLSGEKEPRGHYPALVVCPKSVTDNWSSECARFAPDLRAIILSRGASESDLEEARAKYDLVVLNYAQLRSLDTALTSVPWSAVILDEAQAIKNPESQTARVAWSLKSPHRLALSGTPIENKLLDLWSIMAFAMPGVLGQRGQFSKAFDQRGDPLARRRLSARVRPFVLRRTKSEVAADLPARIEEDLHCEMEGAQLTLYRAELKRARASLLRLQTQAQLDAQRFHVLTSLLRLRQICCHPALISEKSADAPSAKLDALLDLLEPLVAEGHKVLVFSQFVGMLERIERDLVSREWPIFKLTGETEDRGTLVREFQQREGAAIFLISLRAGGFGLNLTAASYVVLFDPWWNPAVEAQAIDRTHRIGQTNKVIAYRLLVKDSIEEKIRNLQLQKQSLASDILGEETFARSLTLDDFRFLLEE
jgi:hypothetical protein